MIDERGILLRVLGKYEISDKWVDADFERVKRLPNTNIGDVGQNFIEELCNAIGFSTNFPLREDGTRGRNSPWDIEIEGVKFELKTATEDVSGNFQFNHIRYHRDYDALLCLGISPNSIQFDIWSKADVSTRGAGNLVTMDMGSSATFKLTKKQSQLQPISVFEESMREFLAKFKG